jgi:hypothetical protein
MRYQSRILLLAALLIVPQVTFSANGWGDSRPFTGGHPSAATAPASPGAASMGRYRSASWPSGPGFAPADPMARAWQGGGRFRSSYPPGYRFRPLPPARPGDVVQQVRYRPLQIRIPDRYVFRPLKPAAPRVPPMPARMASRDPGMANPWAGGVYGRHYGNPYRPVFNNRFSPVRSFPVAPWAGGVNAYRPPYPVPPQRATAPAYARAANPMPRFRPWPRPRWAYTPPPGYIPGYVQPRAYPGVPPGRRDMRWRRWQPGTGRDYREQRVQVPALSRAIPNPYDTDWYDGRGDVDGAWYRLTLESSPVVSQSWTPLPAPAGSINPLGRSR